MKILDATTRCIGFRRPANKKVYTTSTSSKKSQKGTVPVLSRVRSHPGSTVRASHDTNEPRLGVSPLETLVDFHQASTLLGVVVEHLVVLGKGEEPVGTLLRQLRADRLEENQSPKKRTRERERERTASNARPYANQQRITIAGDEDYSSRANRTTHQPTCKTRRDQVGIGTVMIITLRWYKMAKYKWFAAPGSRAVTTSPKYTNRFPHALPAMTNLHGFVHSVTAKKHHDIHISVQYEVAEIRSCLTGIEIVSSHWPDYQHSTNDMTHSTKTLSPTSAHTSGENMHTGLGSVKALIYPPRLYLLLVLLAPVSITHIKSNP